MAVGFECYSCTGGVFSVVCWRNLGFSLTPVAAVSFGCLLGALPSLSPARLSPVTESTAVSCGSFRFCVEAVLSSGTKSNSPPLLALLALPITPAVAVVAVALAGGTESKRPLDLGAGSDSKRSAYSFRYSERAVE